MKAAIYCRVNSFEQAGGGVKVAKKEKSMIDRIQDSGRVGYAYFYPRDGGQRQEFYISTTPENLAKFLGIHYLDAERMVVTDIADRLILDTIGGYIDKCPDQGLCREIIPYLAPIQRGEKNAGEILMVTRDEADAYFQAEDEEVTMAEEQML